MSATSDGFAITSGTGVNFPRRSRRHRGHFSTPVSRQSYGTVICDLERHRIVALLAGRDADTVERWLKEHPGICVVARDRGGACARATARALPDAVQVADRWHLFANASAAFLEAVRRSMKEIRRALGTTAIDPSLAAAELARSLHGNAEPALAGRLPQWR